MPEWFKTLPLPVLSLVALVVAGVWAAQRLGLVKKNGALAIQHKTFADDEEKYWRHMADVVTHPLSEVLKATNEILRELRDRAIKEEGREEGLRKRNR